MRPSRARSRSFRCVGGAAIVSGLVATAALFIELLPFREWTRARRHQDALRPLASHRLGLQMIELVAGGCRTSDDSERWLGSTRGGLTVGARVRASTDRSAGAAPAVRSGAFQFRRWLREYREAPRRAHEQHPLPFERRRGASLPACKRTRVSETLVLSLGCRSRSRRTSRRGRLQLLRLRARHQQGRHRAW